ncbi:DUF3027 domain-containing protein [Scytonema tolypothrichoides VB-61278]|nr:DUF3027 domain-containing protein [Scytonema tolypothrichoides VB-61278]
MQQPLRKQAQSEEHGRQCHGRWIVLLHRDMNSPNYKDEWYGEQCGGCAYYIRLEGVLHEDWGVCSNEESPCDGTVRFEHDGCEAFVESLDGW